MKEKLKKTFATRRFRAGGYSFAASLIVLLLAVALVLTVNALPERYTAFDMTEEGLYSLSDETETRLRALEQDVTVYLLATEGSEDAALSALLSRCASLSGHLSVETVDPVKNPAFAKQYTDQLRYNNSLIVVSGERSRFVDYTELYQTDYTQYYQSYDENDIVTTFDAEAVLNAAISFVTSGELPTLYSLSGHGESELSGSFLRAVTGANYRCETLSLLSSPAVPEDCDCLFLYAPQSDLSETELEKLTRYLDAGGKLMLVTGYGRDEMPRLASLTARYGLSLEEGLILERDAEQYVYGYADCLLPTIRAHEITSSLAEKSGYLVLPDAQAISLTEADAEASALLTTSDSAYLVTDVSDISYHDGDVVGPFNVGVAAVRGESRIVWYSSELFLSEQYSEAFGGLNAELFVRSLGWLCERENTPASAGKSLASERLTLTAASAAKLGALITVFIPLLFAACGAVVIVRRRRRG